MMTSLFNLYLEILHFLQSCGGPYEVHDEETCFNLAEAVTVGQYILARDDEGKIKYFLDYWAVSPEDLHIVEKGGRPFDVKTGSSCYVLDFGFKGKYREIRGEIARELRKRFPDGKGIAWHHKNKQSGSFRFYPSQRGATNG